MGRGRHGAGEHGACDVRKVFNVWPLLDTEVNRWISRTDIWGLNIETGDLDEFYEVLADLAQEMIEANHGDEIGEAMPVVIVHPPQEFDEQVWEAA